MNALGCLSGVLFNIGVQSLSLLIGLPFRSLSSNTRAMGRFGNRTPSKAFGSNKVNALGPPSHIFQEGEGHI